MKKKIMPIILLFIIFPVFGEPSLSEKQRLAVINKMTETESLEECSYLASYKGNFTGSGKDEFLIFLGRKYKEKEKRQPSIRNTVVAIFSGEELIVIYKVPYYTSLDKGCYESGKLGKGTSQGWIKDYNGNGLDELLFTESYGSFMIWETFEFINGRFKKTFDFPHCIDIKSYDDSKKEITIIHYLYTDSKGYYKNVEKKLVWNEKAKEYSVLDDE